MDMKKLAPWNWFKKENENMGKTLPVKRGDGLHKDRQAGNPLQAFHQEVDRLFADVFQRILSLPEDADQDNVNARFKNGILQVKIPRKPLPAPEARQIEIQAQ